MKQYLGSAVVGAGLWLAAQVSGASVVDLQLERSTDLNQWEPVPLSPASLNSQGAIVQTNEGQPTFYRLRIQSSEANGFMTALPLSEVPGNAVEIARQFLGDWQFQDEESNGGDPEGGWQDAELGPVAYPVYDPSYLDGTEPAYIEFKVVKKPSPQPDPASIAEGGPIGTPDLTSDGCDLGYLLVSLTERDVPVPGFSQGGPTLVEVLLKRSQARGPVRAVRFDDGLLVAEDEDGRLVGSIGNSPIQIDPAVLDVMGEEFEGQADESGEQGDSPEFPAGGYESYEQFKEDFLSNPFYEVLRERRAQLAKAEWDLLNGMEPPILDVPIDGPVLLLPDTPVQQAWVDDPAIVEINVSVPEPGVWATGLQLGGTLMTVILPDGSQEHYALVVGGGPARGMASLRGIARWTPWNFWFAGSWSDQRRYRQFWQDSQMCPGGWSGCGPTAWAMLYGWWDRHGSPRCLKNSSLADAPLQNDWSVRDCCQYIFPHVGSFCVFGRAATLPWNMKNGYRWARMRGAGYHISWWWGVPYASPGSRNKGIASLKAGRPSIIGMGFYWHYALAYAYAQRDYRILGISVWTSRYFKCNMGLGGDKPEWRNAISTWFATDARFW